MFFLSIYLGRLLQRMKVPLGPRYQGFPPQSNPSITGDTLHCNKGYLVILSLIKHLPANIT